MNEQGTADFDRADLAALRRRPGAKWSRVGPDVIPAWVADMDFPPSPVILGALRAALDTGDLGYPAWFGATPLRRAFADRMADRFGWQLDPGAVREVTDLIQGLQLALQLATEPGDAVAIHVPAYPPFLSSIPRMGRRLVPLPLSEVDGGWTFDLAQTERAVVEAGVKVLVLVNPHNPTGRVFTAAELTALADLARRHDLTVISDEIHADLVYPGHRHRPFAGISDDAASRTVTLTSASKSFNLAGLRCAVLHLGPPRLVAARDAQPSELFGGVNLLAVRATLAAWSPEADPWLTALLAHLDRNRRRVLEVLGERLPAARVLAPEGTYLAWIDARGLELGPRPAQAFARAGVRLSPGEDFGPGGEGFVRLNFATAGPVLEEILDRICQVNTTEA